MGALSGVRVVDLSRILAGPHCSQTLADHGADVIKIEPPGGDETRGWGPPFEDGESAYFRGLNRGKRGLALDLARAPGRDILLRLLGGADVLVENFKAGTLERWGLGYEEVLQPRHPRLIHCRISGFGGDGPLGGLPGYDAVAQAMSGLMAINGHADGPPVRIGAPVADLAAAMIAVQGIAMALYERERSGRGQGIEVSLLDAALGLLHPHAANYLMSGRRPGRTGSAHPNIAPYDLFATATAPVFLAIGNDRQFARLVAELGRPGLATDPRFLGNAHRLANREALTALLLALMRDRDGPALAERLLAQGVPAGAVLEVDEVLAHPQVRARAMLVEREGYRGLGLPLKLQRTPGAPGARPPRLAEHARAVLAEAGLSKEEIDDRLADGTVSAA
jgi:crotonobetainyl-CoA:carnitine CoA-transferase CaiB-like acyl-CoA transferase